MAPSETEKVPWSRVAPIVLSVFCYFFSVHIVIPFLPFMTKSFLDRPRNELGYFVGFLASSYFIGDFFGAVFWGRVADRSGRRKVMLISPALTAVVVIAFGCSQSFTWAVITRLLWGFMASLVSVAKTMLADLSTNATQARLFALMGVGNGLARLSAPALGGILSEPAKKFSSLDTPSFRQFPYLLPCLIGAILTIINLLVNFYFLEETYKKPSRPAVAAAVADPVVEDSADGEIEETVTGSECTANGGAMHMVVLSDGGAASSDEISLIDNSAEEDYGEDGVLNVVRRSSKSRVFARLRANSSRFQGKLGGRPVKRTWLAVQRHFEAYRLLKSPLIVWPLVCYGFLAFTSMITFEVLPLLLINTSAHGGFCLNSAEIGIIYAAAGVVQLTNQLLIYPRLAKRLGFRRLFRTMLSIFSCSVLILPWSVKIIGPQDPPPLEVVNGTIINASCSSGYIAGSTSLARSIYLPTGTSGPVTHADIVTPTAAPSLGECYAPPSFFTRNGNETEASDDSFQDQFSDVSCIPWWVYLSLISFTVPLTLSVIMSFTSANIMTNNSCTPDVRATVNGIAQSFASVGRFFGPLISILFAWSTTNNQSFPFNYHLTFWLIAFFNLLNIFLSRHLTTNVESRTPAQDIDRGNGSVHEELNPLVVEREVATTSLSPDRDLGVDV